MKEIGGILVLMKNLIKRMGKWVFTCTPLLLQYGKFCFINTITIYNNSYVCDSSH